MSDTFQGNYTGLTFPGYSCAAVTPSDTNDLPIISRALYVGTGGDVAVELENDTPGTPTVFKNVASGTLLPLRVRRVHATNTTASNIVAIW